MIPPTCEVSLGGLTVRVPTFKSVEDTRQIVESINARLKDLESTSTRVNTQAFALMAAYEFAKALHELQDEMAVRDAAVATRVVDLADKLTEFASIIERAE